MNTPTSGSRAHFPRSYFFPDKMRFANSEGLFPSAEWAATIQQEYETQCRILCYGPFPTWSQVRTRFEHMRGLL